jgi:hypothetical protein
MRTSFFKSSPFSSAIGVSKRFKLYKDLSEMSLPISSILAIGHPVILSSCRAGKSGTDSNDSTLVFSMLRDFNFGQFSMPAI